MTEAVVNSMLIEFLEQDRQRAARRAEQICLAVGCRERRHTVGVTQELRGTVGRALVRAGGRLAGQSA